MTNSSGVHLCWRSFGPSLPPSEIAGSKAEVGFSQWKADFPFSIPESRTTSPGLLSCAGHPRRP
jgi:hypothetical protein